MRGYKYVMEHQVTADEVDEAGHLNSAKLVSLLEQGRIGYMESLTGNRQDAYLFILAELTVSFRSEAFSGETIQVGTRVATVRDRSFIYEAFVAEKESGRVVAVAGQVMVPYDHSGRQSAEFPEWWLGKVEAFEGQRFRA